MHPLGPPLGRHGAEPTDGIHPGNGGVQAGCGGPAGGVAVSAGGETGPDGPAAVHDGIHHTRLLSRYMSTFDRRDDMVTIHAISGRTLALGREGENLARQVVFDISEWRASYGDGTVSLIAQRHGDAEPYPCNITVDGDTVTWPITSADTACPDYGHCELRYTVGDVLVKSEMWRTFVADALGTPQPEPPEPQKAWVDKVLAAGQDATESAESAKKAATESAESAKQAAASREAIENMEAAAVSLPPNSKATVEKDLVDDKVKLTFGIPRGETDIFWLNTDGPSSIAETFDEIVAAYKAGKSIWVRDTHSFSGGVLTAPEFIAIPLGYDEDDIVGMIIVCGGSAYSSYDIIGEPDGITNATYYIQASPEEVTYTFVLNNDTVSAVSSVNGKTGDVTLTAGDVGAVSVPATASVGQTIVVKAVDDSGKPTEWEAADMLPKSPTDWEPWTTEEQAAARDRIGIDKPFELIEEIVCDGEATAYTRTVDVNGNPYNLLSVYIEFEIETGNSYTSSVFFRAYDAESNTVLYDGNLVNQKNYVSYLLGGVDAKNGMYQGWMINGNTASYNSGGSNTKRINRRAPIISPIKKIHITVSGGLKFLSGDKIRIYGVRA